MIKPPLSLDPRMTKKGLKKYARMIAKWNGYDINAESSKPKSTQSITRQRQERVRDLALLLVAKQRGTRVSEARIELKMNWKEFHGEFQQAYPNAGHVMFHNQTALSRACRLHKPSGEWPHIYFKAGRPRKTPP